MTIASSFRHLPEWPVFISLPLRAVLVGIQPAVFLQAIIVRLSSLWRVEFHVLIEIVDSRMDAFLFQYSIPHVGGLGRCGLDMWAHDNNQFLAAANLLGLLE